MMYRLRKLHLSAKLLCCALVEVQRVMSAVNQLKLLSRHPADLSSASGEYYLFALSLFGKKFL